MKAIGTWWNDSSIELVEIDGKIYALDGWNGEQYSHCWQCSDRFTNIGDEEYEIKPIYDEEYENIIGYKVI